MWESAWAVGASCVLILLGIFTVVISPVGWIRLEVRQSMSAAREADLLPACLLTPLLV